MYLLRFKRHKQAHVYLALEDLNRPYTWTLTDKAEDAMLFAELGNARAVIGDIAKLVFPKTAFEFDTTTLFLIRLFGQDWSDQVEGICIDMDDVIKAQIIGQHGPMVFETIRLRNPIWEQHYA